MHKKRLHNLTSIWALLLLKNVKLKALEDFSVLKLEQWLSAASVTSNSGICHMADCTVSGLIQFINLSFCTTSASQMKDWGTLSLQISSSFVLLTLVKLVFLFTHFEERGSLACSLAGSCRRKGSGKAAKTGKTTWSVTSHARSKTKGWKARQSQGWGRGFSFQGSRFVYLSHTKLYRV